MTPARAALALLCLVALPFGQDGEVEAVPELALQHGAYLYPNFLVALSASGDPDEARSMMQADGVHPTAEGVRRIVADIGPLVLEMIEEHAPES